MQIKSFDSIEELLEHIAAENERGREAAKDHPVKVSELRHGDCVVSPRPDYGVMVFGEVLERTEYPEDAENIQMSRLNGFVFGRWYSPLCVEGEYGDTHITNIATKIPREVFERAKINGFRHIYSVD
jgi:hypothetical protein